MGAAESVVIFETTTNQLDEWDVVETYSSDKHGNILRLYKHLKPVSVYSEEDGETTKSDSNVEASLFSTQVSLEEECEDVYPIVLMNPHSENNVAFNMFRMENKEDAMKKFKETCDLLSPYIDVYPSVFTAEKLTSLVKLRQTYPSWSVSKVGAYLKLPEVEEANTPKVMYSRQQSLHQQETLELIKREQPSFARDFFGSTPMQFLVERHPELVSNLVSTIDSLTQTGKDLRDGLDNITKYAESPIHAAIRLSQESVLKLLLEKGANASIPCGHAYPIHLAVKHQSKGCLKLLVEHDRECLKMKDKKYEASALHWVKSSEQIDMLAREPEVDLNSRNFENETPLHIMVKRGRLQATISLVCHGANINAEGKDNKTSLHCAVQLGNYDVIRALLFLGANRLLKDDVEKIPLDYLDKEKTPNYHDILDVFELFSCIGTCETKVKPPEKDRTQSVLKKKTGKESLLALDGGGIRGLVLTEVLFAVQGITGYNVKELFDWISGTSTGSFLAMSLALGRSVRSCQLAYLRLGRSCLLGIRPYPTEQLDQFLIDEFGEDTKMDAFDFPREEILALHGNGCYLKTLTSKYRVIIPAVVADRRPAQLFLFRNYNAPYDEHYKSRDARFPRPFSPAGDNRPCVLVRPYDEHYKSRDARFPRPFSPADQATWLAIRSSCSAPSYFRSTGRYLDGGLVATNPTLDAISEIHKYEKYYDTKTKTKDKKPKTNLAVALSVGTGSAPMEVLRPIDIYRPSSVWDTAEIVDNLKGFVDLMIDQVSAKDYHIVDRARSWCEMCDIDYYRMQPNMSSDIELNETDDRVLLDLLCDVRKYLSKNIDLLKNVCKKLLGEEEETVKTE